MQRIPSLFRMVICAAWAQERDTVQGLGMVHFGIGWGESGVRSIYSREQNPVKSENRPTPFQEVLLRAALLDGAAAREAWEKWKSAVDIEDLDPGSTQLLPLLYRNLKRMGVSHPQMERFKGVYRVTWYKNQMLFRDGATVARCLEQAGIRTLLLKGAALIVECYHEHGLRAMADFDILVPFREALAAIELLKKHNWVPEFDFSDRVLKSFVRSRHSLGFTSPSGNSLDLHWHVLQDYCREDDDRDFWEGSHPSRVHGIPTRILGPADQLLHVCLHGAIWNPVPTLRWIADSVMILNTFPQPDWNRLVSLSRQRCRTAAMAEALTYLSENFDQPIPRHVLSALRATPVSRRERLEYAAASSPIRNRGPFLSFWLRYCWHVRSELGRGSLSRFVTFPRFLQFIWRRERLRQVPLFALREGVLRLWHQAVPPAGSAPLL